MFDCKKISAAVLTVVTAIGIAASVPAQAYASSEPVMNESDMHSFEFTGITEADDDSSDTSSSDTTDVIGAQTSVSTSSGSDVYYADSREDLVLALRENGLKRAATYNVVWTGSQDSMMTAIKSDNGLCGLIYSLPEYDRADTTSDGDYLMNSITGISLHGTCTSSGIYLTFKVTYTETLKQTKAVDRKVSRICRKLKISRTSSLRKKISNLRKIERYVCKTVNYDYSLTNRSAYAGLCKSSHKVVCQGYANIIYKLCAKAGIKAHIIYGYGGTKSSSNAHCWNIVKVGKKWYNIDATWDDTNSSKKPYSTGRYFLVGSKVFNRKHITADSFQGLYNISTKSCKQ